MDHQLRQLKDRFIATVAAMMLATAPGWTAASAGSTPTAVATASPVPAGAAESVKQNEARAVELASRFFDPLIADAKKDVDRASLLHQRGVLFLSSHCKTRALSDLNDA
ncbi:MAG: hypothetical protein ABUL72_05720, partial [Armatimonadota bacterium]